MTKPLAEKSLLDDIQGKYGSHLENVTWKEKLVLIQLMSFQLSECCDGLTRVEILHLASKAKEELSTSDQIGLIEALTSQIKGELLTNTRSPYSSRIES